MIALSRLRRRPLVGVYLLVSLVPLVALSFFAVAISTDAVSRRADQSLTLSAALSARYVGERIKSLEAVVSSFAHEPDFVAAVAQDKPDSQGQTTIADTLHQLSGVRSGIANALLLSADGRLRDAFPLRADPTGPGQSINQWFQATSSSKASYVSPMYASWAYGSPLVTAIASPVTEVGGDGTQGPLLGVLGVEYSVTGVEQFAQEFAAAQGVRVTVVDQSGKTVAESVSGGGADVERVLTPSRRGQSGLLKPADPDGDLIAFAPITGIGWTVAAELSAAEAFADVDRLRLTVIAFAIPLGLVLLVGAWMLNTTLGYWERAEAEVRRLAAIDPLTGVYNRRSWDEHLLRELARARRERVPLSVMMIDLDHFKRFNDEHGHQAGDRLLVEAAAAWKSVIRATDILARYGGEEFSVALADCSADDAVLIANRLRTGIPSGQTCSAGVATWNGVESGGTLVARADRALYEAKRQGRDRVVVAEDSAAAA